MAIAAFFLVPVAQAAAEGTLKVNIAGSGTGEVKDLTIFNHTEPEIECPGVCEGVISEENPYDDIGAYAGEGSEFAGWTIASGTSVAGCNNDAEEKEFLREIGDPELDGFCTIEPSEGVAEITATFEPEPVPPPVLKVNIAGSGSGEVKDLPIFNHTEPEIECPGVCEGVINESNPYDDIGAYAGEGSEFAGWTIASGTAVAGCNNDEEEKGFIKEIGDPELDGFCTIEPKSGVAEITATFEPEEVEPPKPTNRRTLTVTKSPNPASGEGTGTVLSKPKGIKCGSYCTEAVASMYVGTPVLLKAKPSKENLFVKWTGACEGFGSTPECTIPMEADESVGAVFSGPSKPVLNPTPLTVDKGAGSGEGTVKGAGLKCEAACTETTVLYQGPLSEPKVKPGKTVVLKQAPAFGSAFTGWVGCDEEVEGNCVVEMSEAKTVSAEYATLPNLDLTVEKGPYESGAGTVSSKPKGIKCGSYCTQAIASMPEGAAVELKEKPAKENLFVKWEGGDCEGQTSEVCIVTMDTAETITAVFAGPTKTIVNPQTLTVTKGASTGYGTVKGAGLKCEALCTSTSVFYTGPITEPKEKPGKTVVLKSLAAPGSAAVLWGGCDEVDVEGNCVVHMEASREVTGTFEELE
ncbi:MAG: InlB B-repeat-containing protein [Chloroflexota bacterium]